jgi:hypothetical protein
MNTVIVEPNAYTGSYLVQTIALNLTQPDLPMKSVSEELNDIFENSHRHFLNNMVSPHIEEKWLNRALLSVDNLSIICTRLIDKLVDENYKVLYITYNQDNIDMLRKKRHVVDKLDDFDLEEHLSSTTEETYNFCRADSHPTWEEFKAGNIHPEFLSNPNDVNLDDDPLSNWTYNTPDDSKLCCEIKFNSILHGYDIVDNIADLLEVKIRSDQKSLLDEYREKFFEVDY